MEYSILSKINSPDDVKKLNESELDLLCDEVRDCLINTVSKNGGHLASNLGVVELTIAIHKAFNCPKDKLIFDVGHQCYTHKLLTGRYDRFDTLRQENGLSGFMRPSESKYDPFVTGHSSNSVSAALGIYKAARLVEKERNFVISVVGDGAMTGGMIYEALNSAGSGKNSSFIVILNDNKMSISTNVGAFARYLNIIRSRPSYHHFKHRIESFFGAIPVIGKFINRNLLRSKTLLKNAIYHSNIFEDMGFNYLGPVDGHDLQKLDRIFKIAKEQKRPVLIHVLTVKGKGYEFAENSPKNYHGVSAFDVENGAENAYKADFSACVGDELCKFASEDEKLCVVTAAMTAGTGLTEFSERYKNRFFDVGIAEEHAVTFTAGLAAGGAHAVFAVYSSFLQRGYDQILHDIGVAGLNVTLCVDRAGIVGEDGETHQGLFDIAFLKSVPGMTIFSPSNYLELKSMLRTSVYDVNGPSAVRYPRGFEPVLPKDYIFLNEDYSFYGDCTSDTVLITFGRTFAEAVKAYERLKEQGVSVAILKLNKIYPIEDKLFGELLRYKNIMIFEEGIRSGGINETICSKLAENDYKGKINVFAVNDEYVPQCKTDSALKKYCLESDSICRAVVNVIEE